MKYFITNIENDTLKNNNFRKVIYTAKKQQLVLMSLKPLEDIGMEIHKGVDQFIRIEKGRGVAVLNGDTYALRDGVCIVIPSGVEHNIINTSKKNALKLYTIYSPPEHKPNTILKNKK